jgi:long-chain acyl-CoA synthetase
MTDKPWLSHYDEGVAGTLVYPAIPLQALLTNSAQKFPDHICLHYFDHRFTYEQVVQLSRRVAFALQNIGLQQGQSVGLVLPNIPQFVFAYFGVLIAGGVVVPLNPVYTLTELEGQCKQAEVQWIIGWEPRKKVLQQLTNDLRLQTLILTNDADLDGVSSFQEDKQKKKNERELSFSMFLSFSQNGREERVVSTNSTAVLQFSGGTTGSSKAVNTLHRNLVANTLQFREWLRCLADGQEHFLAAIPLSHVYGMVIGLNVGLAMGATIHLIPDARDVQAILRIIQDQNISFFPGVPAMFYAINQNPDVVAKKYQLNSIKACISGSAPLHPDIRRDFEALTGGHLVEGYGLSEAPTATHCNPIEGENRTGSIGLPLPDVDCKIVPIAGSPEGIGELWVKGPQVMSGYFKQEKETESALKEGWLRTGDTGRMDKDGYFYLLGRNKELIKVGGFQVWPREVEEVLMQLTEIQEAAVAGIPDLSKGELVKAWVVLRDGQSLDQEKIKSFCRNYLAPFKVPAEVKFVKSLPKTPVGKVMKRELINIK